MKHCPAAILSAFILLLLPSLSLAHHGFAQHFDPDRLIRIEGSVKKVEFINPHGLLYIDAVSEAGEPVVYICDLMARTQLVRRNFDFSVIKVGDPIVVEAYAARRDPHGCEFGEGHFADGSSFTMRTTDTASSVFADNIEIPVESREHSIFGNWIREGMDGDASGTGRRGGENSITAAGLEARAAFDPIADNPVVHCKGGSPVRNWGAPGLATSINRDGDNIVIYHESMDVTRTVYMNLSELPAGVEPSEMGHSIGHFEGDTLVVDTAAFADGVLNGSTLHTDKMTMEERITVLEDSGRLQISWVVNEPVYYSEPLTGSQILQSTSQPIVPYECNPEWAEAVE